MKVNQNKSAVDRPWKRKFLGFSFTNDKEPKVRIAKESVKRMKNKIREITSRKKPYSDGISNQETQPVLMGWCGYFALADTPSVFKNSIHGFEEDFECVCGTWKKPGTKVRKLIGLGVPKGKAYEWGNSRKGYWRISKSPILHRTLENSYWSSQGLKSLAIRYETLRHQS